MRFRKIQSSRVSQIALSIAVVSGGVVPAAAATFGTPTVFATGVTVSSTAPDSVTYGNGSVWVEYGNSVSSTAVPGTAGSGTIVQYSTAGAIQNTYSIGGSVDGLKYNPNTGMVWALQNQDGNSQLSIINPSNKAISVFSYGAQYTPASQTRGFDDVAFVGNNVYLSQTNPATTADAVVVQLTSSTPSTPLTYTNTVTGVGILATDPDSLKSTPSGGLVLTGEGDHALTFISNPGLASQTVTSIHLTGANGATLGSPDDSIYATATSGTFYLTDTSTNIVYALAASGLIPGSSLCVNVGNEFGSVDQATRIVTPILIGVGLHGLEFVPNAPVPEPSSFGIAFAGLGLGALTLLRKRFAR